MDSRDSAAFLSALFIHHISANRDGIGFPAAVQNSLVLLSFFGHPASQRLRKHASGFSELWKQHLSSIVVSLLG